MRMNIYLPDDLAADVKAELGEANISGIAQNALRVELARVRGLNEALGEGGFQRVEAVDGEEHVSFQGRKIGSAGYVTAYLTPKGNIAVVDKGEDQLYVYEDYEILIAEWEDAGRAREMVTEVARALGKKHVRELDI